MYLISNATLSHDDKTIFFFLNNNSFQIGNHRLCITQKQNTKLFYLATCIYHYTPAAASMSAADRFSLFIIHLFDYHTQIIMFWLHNTNSVSHTRTLFRGTGGLHFFPTRYEPNYSPTYS